ncbi:MAG: flagellar basal body rod protein FlgB [Gammaproteobacteria bacterium]|nr:flagellar basal body rod protein FlgB [Gammaproteobacteria bacterium]
MPITLDGAFGVHEQALGLYAQRAEILATNLANADTPHYRARDIDFKAALASAQAAGDHTSVAVTHAKHIQPGTGIRDEYSLLYRNPSQASLDGNTVDTQVEHAEFAQNALRYSASITFLNGKIKGLLGAIRGE